MGIFDFVIEISRTEMEIYLVYKSYEIIYEITGKIEIINAIIIKIKRMDYIQIKALIINSFEKP